MNVRPPALKDSWDDCDIVDRADLIAYSQLREHEELELEYTFLNNLAKLVVR